MIFYAIRRKSDGFFLPALVMDEEGMFLRKRIRRRGFTHSEPSRLKSSYPRLFMTKKGARMALDYWLCGAYTEAQCGDFGEDSYLKRVEKPRRKKEDMEIVKIVLSVKGIV